MTTIQDLRKMTEADLEIELKKAREEVGKLGFSIKSGKEKAVHEMKKWKKYIAQILTVKQSITN